MVPAHNRVNEAADLMPAKPAASVRTAEERKYAVAVLRQRVDTKKTTQRCFCARPSPALHFSSIDK